MICKLSSRLASLILLLTVLVVAMPVQATRRTSPSPSTRGEPRASQNTTGCIAPREGLVSWWSGNGDANDLEGRNNGSLVNGAAFFNSGKVDQAFLLDGIDDHVRVEDSASLDITDQLSIEGWIYPTAFTVRYSLILSKWDAVGVEQRSYGMGLDSTNNKVYFRVSPDGREWGVRVGTVYASSAIPLFQWTHVAGTYDGQSMRIYVDGELSNQVAHDQGIYSGSCDVGLGAGVCGVGYGDFRYPFKGLLDEISIYDRALTTSEIQAIYAAGSNGKCRRSAITGRVSDGAGNPIAEAMIGTSTVYSTTTNTIGHYILALPAGAYTLTPSKPGYSFSPASRTVTVPPNATGQDFVGTASTISITGVEVTQATQCINNADCFGAAHTTWCNTADCTNSVPLVVNKPTWVRVYVSSQQDGQQAKALLKGYYQDGSDLPGSPLLSQSIISAHPNGGDRGKADDSINFRLPVEWTRQRNITLEARIYGVSGPSLDSRQVALSFSDRNAMPVFSWRFRFPSAEATTQTEAQAAARFAAQVYPISADAIDLRDQGELATKARTWQQLTADLSKSCKDAKRNSGYSAARCYGWIPQGITMQSGDGHTYFGWTAGGVSVGYIYWPPLAGGAQNLAPRYIMAHEIGHTFSPLNHVATASCGGSGGGQYESQFPNTTGSVGEYGFYDDGTARVYVPRVTLPDHPISYFDFMSYCGVNANRQWVSPYTYRHLYEALGAPDLASALTASPASTQPYLIASGVITPSGSISLDPFYREQYPVGSYDTAGTGTYRLDLQDTQGNVLFTRFFDQTAPEWLDAGAPIHFFEIMPLAPGTTKVVVKQDATTLGQVSASSNPPQVTLVEPQPGVVSGDTLQIEWTGSDLDGDQVKYMIEYSADGGQTWQTLALNLEDTSLAVKTADLPGSNQAKVRVLATDGLNTATAESGVLLVPAKVPRATIISPEGGALLPPGQPINLSGMAEDREDGALNGAALTWTLDSSTAIGTGTQLTLFNPPTGRHVITLTAQDSSDRTASVSISVFIGYQMYLPLSLRNQ